jgi:hypothetical protein
MLSPLMYNPGRWWLIVLIGKDDVKDKISLEDSKCGDMAALLQFY